MRRGLATIPLLLLVLAMPATLTAQPELVATATLHTDRLAASTFIRHIPSQQLTVVGLPFELPVEIGGITYTPLGGSDVLLIGYDRKLSAKWVVQCGGMGNDRLADVITSDGGVIVALACGSNTTTFTTYQVGNIQLGGRGNTDAVIAKIGYDGSVLWARNDGGSSWEIPEALVQFADGTILVAGAFGKESRFGTSEISNEHAGNAGYIQRLDANGNHQELIWAKPRDGSLHNDFYPFAWSDIDKVNGTARLLTSINGRYEFGGEFYEIYQSLIWFSVDQTPSIARTIRGDSCLPAPSWKTSTYPGSELSVTFTARPRFPCTSYGRTALLWQSTFDAEPEVIGSHGDGESAIRSLQEDDRRTLIAGYTVDTLDLFNSPRSPDIRSAIPGQQIGFVASFLRSGTPQWVVAFDDTTDGCDVTAGITSFGFVAAVSALDTIRSFAQPIPARRGDVILMSFIDPTVSVQETDPHERHPEPRSGEGPLSGFGSASGPLTIHDLTGRLLGTVAAPVHSDALRARLLEYSGPLILRQGTRVSLCHVYGPDHIAFALPAGSPR